MMSPVLRAQPRVDGNVLRRRFFFSGQTLVRDAGYLHLIVGFVEVQGDAELRVRAPSPRHPLEYEKICPHGALDLALCALLAIVLCSILPIVLNLVLGRRGSRVSSLVILASDTSLEVVRLGTIASLTDAPLPCQTQVCFVARLEPTRIRW